ncbi:MAG: 4-alpha-glucanotransferase [Verrucomicrobiales bacterium]
MLQNFHIPSSEPVPKQRQAGILTPVFALRRERDLGIGDTQGLMDFMVWMRGYGFRLIQILPINATGPDRSPYNAISSRALDPLTITLEPGRPVDLLPDTFERITGQFPVETLRQRSNVDYPQVTALKHQLLLAAFAQWKKNPSADRLKAFDDFRQHHGEWLEEFALFEACATENHGSIQWDQWEKTPRQATQVKAWLLGQDRSTLERFQERIQFTEYVQWLAFQQWAEVKAMASHLGVSLLGDIPFGVNYYGADVFGAPQMFDLEWSGGAPPEPAFQDSLFVQRWGQNWGIPLYNWDAMATDGFQWWKKRLSTLLETAHGCRIDHVLGFYRLYCFPWRPERDHEFAALSHEEVRSITHGRVPGFFPHDDWSVENAEANLRIGDLRLRALVEDHGSALIVGEDLGTVPDYMRPHLQSLGIWTMKIPFWERQPGHRLVPGSAYEETTLATYATHDHPPLKEWWEQRQQQAGHHNAHAQWEREILMEFAKGEEWRDLSWGHALHERLVQGLLASRSRLAVLMLSDVFGRADRFNTPGSVSESNWSTRMHASIESLVRDVETSQKLQRLQEAIVLSGR